MKAMKKRVGIVGGGFAGSLIAQKLEKKCEVTLYDTKDYFEFTPSILRTIIKPTHAKKIQVLHANYLNQATIIQDRVLEITKNKIITQKSTQIYDYIVICSGSAYRQPIKDKELLLASRAKDLRNYHTKLKKENHILIVGGGVVGVELAAEIATHYKNKKVTLVHSREQLLPRLPKKAQEYAKKFLEKRGVEMIFGEKVEKKGKNSYITNKGTKIPAQMIVSCTGIIPNSQFLKKNFSKQLNERGCLEVEQTLQIKGYKSVFAAGDITGIKEEKTAQGAQKQAKVVAHNILADIKTTKQETYTTQKRPMVISLGAYDGILVNKKLVLTGILPCILKKIVEKKAMFAYR